jgi:hypothetical protein
MYPVRGVDDGRELLSTTASEISPWPQAECAENPTQGELAENAMYGLPTAGGPMD